MDVCAVCGGVGWGGRVRGALQLPGGLWFPLLLMTVAVPSLQTLVRGGGLEAIGGGEMKWWVGL